MRRLALFLALIVIGATAFAQSVLVGPRGQREALGEQTLPGGLTLLFRPGAVDRPSWISLPPGEKLVRVEVVWAGGRETLSFPLVEAPDLRYAFAVPARVLAVNLYGPLSGGMAVFQTVTRPETGAWVTRSQNEIRITLPPWSTAPGYEPLLTLTHHPGSPWRAAFSDGSATRSFGLPADLAHWDFAPAAWGFRPSQITVTGDPAGLAAVRLRAIHPEANLPADPATLLAWPGERWRNPDREWFAWTGTSVLVLVTSDYRVQEDYLRRLAFFVEKTGYRGRLVSDAELGSLHGWNAHDYAAPDLARFFSLAALEQFPLNPRERELRDRLTEAGILVPRGIEAWEPGTGALVGVSLESAPALRAALFVHEGYHGLYFTTPAFREGVRTIWDGLSEGARAAFRAYLARSKYDPSDEGLMINEFQAYVLQRPATDWRPFFQGRVLAEVSAAPGQTARWLSEYTEAARSLDSLVNRLYGLRSGVVSTVAVD